MRISEQRSPRKLNRRLLEASAATGIPRIDDYNRARNGVSMFQVFQKDGRRLDAADAFLRPAIKRPNLEVVTGATVLGLELEGDRAVGVRYRGRRGGGTGAGGEVILSAGAIGFTAILILSGIGPRGRRARAGRRRAEPRATGGSVATSRTTATSTMLWEVSEGPDALQAPTSPKHLLEWLLRTTAR